MHWIDLSIFVVYMIAMLGLGFYFLLKNTDAEDYFVGNRNIGSWHIGLSVVATDVGGGFSIGLGGLGFVMGLSGSWLLFTGMLGAWLAAVFLIPKIKKLDEVKRFFTFPQIFEFFYDRRTALLAGIISGVGYLGFTSSQILAGAKLAGATVEAITQDQALLIMGFIVVVYTVMGGIKAVIYSDTVQWIILMVGLIFVGIPLAVMKLGGIAFLRESISAELLSLTNVTFIQIFNWFISIVPIWFVGMTLYQRIFACPDERAAKKAWFIAGVFEYPIMAFMGVGLGLLARVAATQGLFTEFGFADSTGLDAEMGLPLLLKVALPVGFLGIMLAAYFSAIMSTADSCLMASSGNFVTDIYAKVKKFKDDKAFLRASQVATLILGALALVLAMYMENVLELMLYSYAFMVSGLFVPLIGALYWGRSHPTAAFWSMLLGGSTTATLIVGGWELPLGLDANFFGILVSALVFFGLGLALPKREKVVLE